MSENRVADHWALSPLQQGMLFHHLQAPHSGVDIEQLVVHLPEPIDPSRLEAAWRWLVRRHDGLRARMVWQDVEAPRLERLAMMDTPVVVEHRPAHSTDERRERLARFLAADRKRGFELDRAPLLRLTLFAWEASHFTLVWTFHHALLDGRSFQLLLSEVFAVYDEMAGGEPTPRPTPPALDRHIERVDAQRQVAGADAFWRSLLAGITAPTSLAVSSSTLEGGGEPRHGDVWDTVDAATTRRLRTFAATHRLTMNACVMGAWAILLHRYSGDEDVLFGVTRACRGPSGGPADGVIGLLINTVPARAKVRGDARVRSVLTALRQQWLDVRPFEHTPLVRIKAASELAPAQSLFDTLVVFERHRLDTLMRSRGAAWAARDVELHEQTSVPVTLAAYDGEALSLRIGFDRRRLDDDAARRMVGHVRRLLESIAAHPHGTVRDLTLLSDAERLALVSAATPRPAPRASILPPDGEATLHALFEAQAALRPDAVALTCEEESLTYAVVNARANRLARVLVQHGVRPETCVGLRLSRSHDLIVAMLAVLKAGGAYLPLDSASPPDRAAFMLGDAKAPLLLTERALALDMPGRHTTLCVDELLERDDEPADVVNLGITSGPDHLAYVIYTSGTTGTPKGSLITHRNVVRLFPAAAHCFDFDARDVWTLFHSCAFDFSVWEIWGALLHGARLVVVPFHTSRSPDAFQALVAREQVTVLNHTPSAFRAFIQAEQAAGVKATSLRYVIFGGEALDAAMLKPWFELHGDTRPVLVNMYGITETTVHVTHRRITCADLAAGSVIGEPLADLQVHILDTAQQPTPIGVPGEMFVGGAGLARGYLNQPALTEQRFIPDPFSDTVGARLYRTGDRARRLPGRDIEYLGRIDDQVKIRGFRIELGEVESVLRQHRAVRDVVVVALPHTPGALQLVAYLVAPSAPDVSALRRHLLGLLPDYMVPAAFVFLDAIPLNDNGKTDRKALPMPGPQRPELASRFVAPRTAAERTLTVIWAKVLRLDQVGVHDNFYELGGDSILSIQVIAQARRHGLRLSPTLLSAHPTIAALAAAAGVVSAAAAIAPDRVTGGVPLTPIQAWFFEQALDDVHHYNQGLLVTATRPLDSLLLRRALETVSDHHDALRLRYMQGPGGWQQSYCDTPSALPLALVDLAHAPEADERRLIEAIAADAHGSLDLEHGPIWRVVHISRGAERPDHLLLVVHHLAVDGVSWRPLLEDLESAYLQLARKVEPQLPAKTTSYQRWAERLREPSTAETFLGELPWWREAVASPIRSSSATAERASSDDADRAKQALAGAATVITVALTTAETQALLHDVPRAYRTQINDVLLTALLRAWESSEGNAQLLLDVEGHGREPLFEDVDLSRSVGWFTSIFPVRLALPEHGAADGWHPGSVLKSIKEQLRTVPQRGIGYGVLRYGDPGNGLALQPERQVLFNYLGQFDQLLEGSTLFGSAEFSVGPSRSPRQRRRYPLEINGIVTGRRLQVAFTFTPGRHTASRIQHLADSTLDALRQVIVHCQSPGAFGRTPSDFPLARLTAPDLDRLVAVHGDMDDIYPLSPIQTLFLSSGGGTSRFDQWHCTLRGPLDVAAYQRAWHDTVQRHQVLRSTVHADPVHGPVQVVHRHVSLPWTEADWRGTATDSHSERWSAFLAQDRRRPLDLDRPPAMRFALVRLDEACWKFCWSLPALLLDGWSWPLVFRDACECYDAAMRHTAPAAAPVGQYRDYVEWIGRDRQGEDERFWRRTLAGFTTPTPLAAAFPEQSDGAEASAAHDIATPVALSAVTSDALGTAARRAQLTLNVLVQAAWALLLHHHSGLRDIVFGAAFSGRPSDLAGVETIVGPFVNNLPVRVAIDGDETVTTFVRRLHASAAELAACQFTPLLDIQRVSAVPWRLRLFDSLVVFQNYAVDDAAQRFGAAVEIEDFVGPIHTTYPVLVLAEPGVALKVTLITDRRRVNEATARRWSRHLAVLFEQLSGALAGETSVASLLALLPNPVSREVGVSPAAVVMPPRSYAAPQTERERGIAAIWQQLFESEQVGVTDRFFDLGGTSLLLLRLHQRLREAYAAELPITALFEHPTIRALARHLGDVDVPAGAGDRWRGRAELQKRALDRTKARAGRRSA